MITSRCRLYPEFKRDLADLMDKVGNNRWLQALADNAKDDSLRMYDAQQRIVDRLDDELGDNAGWRNLRAAYSLRGTYKRD